MKYTLAHVTHEAVNKIGGIGTVLEGLMTSPVYQEHVGRSILVGPTSAQLEVDPANRLGPSGEVLYSSVDEIDKKGLGPRLHPIEWAFNVSLVYGRRTYEIPGDDRRGAADVLLIDVFNTNPDRLALFKLRLAERLRVDSTAYEKAWDYEEYVRLAEPAFYALMALLQPDELPCILFAHEFMGLPTAFKAIFDGPDYFRTIFHAHECATARNLVEHHVGHDTMFYNVMRQARARDLYVEDVFGDQSAHFRHALVSQAHVCDGVIAVGDETAAEMHFLGQHFDHHHIDLVYNGVPVVAVDLKRKQRAREMLQDYAQQLLGHRPDVLMTHVMRPVISKGIWRDLSVCSHLDGHLGGEGRTAVLFILTSAGGTRRPQDVRTMEAEYNWPRAHRDGYPDLVGPEVEYNQLVERFNLTHEHVQVILVNQFGWDRATIGQRLPESMHITDLRVAADVELGMATYEPFGISPLEPLCAGAICVISSVCGCAGFVDLASEGEGSANVLVADFTEIDQQLSIEQLLKMTREQRDQVESRVSREVAEELMRRLPNSEDARAALVESGQQLALRMGWDRVVSR
ncbi:MAG: glycosyltransferase, partial [Phycisphaerae bacterium]|nr:glycosyltransferase [Phycisphaerae bacterium]